MLQFITHYTDTIDYVESARLALEGGCRWIQLRMKDATDDDFRRAGRAVRELCTQHGARFILDDRVHLVAELGADGVHLGKNDMPIDEARRILGPDAIIGGTANTFEDIVMHVDRGADYIGCGPFRHTTTKARLAPILGLEGYREITRRMQLPRSEGGLGGIFPTVAIGGITADDIPAILATGIPGIALSGTVLRAADPAAEMRRLLSFWK